MRRNGTVFPLAGALGNYVGISVAYAIRAIVGDDPVLKENERWETYGCL